MQWEYNLQSSGNHDEAFSKSVPGLNSMGEQGWELVTVVLAQDPHAKSGSLWWVYKRAIDDESQQHFHLQPNHCVEQVGDVLVIRPVDAPDHLIRKSI